MDDPLSVNLFGFFVQQNHRTGIAYPTLVYVYKVNKESCGILRWLKHENCGILPTIYKFCGFGYISYALKQSGFLRYPLLVAVHGGDWELRVEISCILLTAGFLVIACALCQRIIYMDCYVYNRFFERYCLCFVLCYYMENETDYIYEIDCALIEYNRFFEYISIYLELYEYNQTLYVLILFEYL